MRSKFYRGLALGFVLAVGVAGAMDLTGHVYDAQTRELLAGANVIVVGTQTGVATDAQGAFVLRNLETGAVRIQVSHIGYENVERGLTDEESWTGAISIYLTPKPVRVEGRTVTATRESRDRYDVPLAGNVVSRASLENRNAGRLSAAFEREPGVALSTTGPGIVRPVVRGMYESQVLVMIDGVAMMDLRPGGNHVLLLEPEQMERVEVVRGPGSVLYGSDAIGGVVNFITQTPNPFTSSLLSVDGRFTGGFATLGNMARGNLQLGLGNDRLYATGRYGYKKSGNISDPEKEIPNSNYEGNHLDLVGGVSTPGYDGKLTYHYLVADVGVPLNPGIRHSVFEDETQQFLRAANTVKPGLEILPAVDLNLSWQKHNRHFHLIKPFAANPDTFEQDMQIFLNADGYSGQLLPRLVIGEKFSARFGADYRYQVAESERKSFTINRFDSTENTLSPPRVIPDCHRSDLGVLVQTETDLDPVELFAGVRYDWVDAVSESTGNSPIEPTERSDASWSGNVGAVVHLPWNLNLPVNVGRGFRSPTLLERYFWGPHQTTVDLGNPDLKPEAGFSIDLGLNMKQDRFSWSATGFRNQVSNLIYKQSTGDTVGGMGVDTWFNISEAELLGFELEATVQPIDNLGIHANVSYVEGTDTRADEPLQHIPPMNGSVGIEYRTGVWSTGVDMSWATEPSRPAANEIPTKGFVLVDLGAGIDFEKWLGFGLGLNLRVDNLLNTEYQNFLSRTNKWYSEPGRNVSLSLTAGLPN